jgi:hypothetical protein
MQKKEEHNAFKKKSRINEGKKIFLFCFELEPYFLRFGGVEGDSSRELPANKQPQDRPELTVMSPDNRTESKFILFPNSAIITKHRRSPKTAVSLTTLLNSLELYQLKLITNFIK